MFEVRRTTNSQFYWRFVSTNGNVLGHSENYRNKQDAWHAASIVRGSDTSRPIVDRT